MAHDWSMTCVAQALRILESFKTLLSGGKVDSLDAEEPKQH